MSHYDQKRNKGRCNASGKINEVTALGIGLFAKSIERRLSLQSGHFSTEELRPTPHALAGALFSMLNWWIESADDISPTQRDALFHRMVLPRMAKLYAKHLPKKRISNLYGHLR